MRNILKSFFLCCIVFSGCKNNILEDVVPVKDEQAKTKTVQDPFHTCSHCCAFHHKDCLTKSHCDDMYRIMTDVGGDFNPTNTTQDISDSQAISLLETVFYSHLPMVNVQSFFEAGKRKIASGRFNFNNYQIESLELYSAGDTKISHFIMSKSYADPYLDVFSFYVESGSFYISVHQPLGGGNSDFENYVRNLLEFKRNLYGGIINGW
ncbi:hypothetical protein BN938_1989 [Mucinivorans hirudinis]|uniref:Lipoprotein n=1 Tax=Mucinivorans hirudinis TaxID=1433126 RepID=A0A060R912_9BACT|nr:hypothetical protein BN938_1989 [Mucinivorans hirudinis]